MNLGQIVEQWVEKRPKACALIYEDQEISYDDLNKSINRVANGLKKLGINKGDRVAIMLPNTPEFVFTFYACQKLGAIAVPFNTMYKGKEISHILKDSGSKAIVCLTNFVPLINEIHADLPDLKHIITTGERTLTLADPDSTLFIQAVITKNNFTNLDNAYQRIGTIMEHSLHSLGIKKAWYKQRGSIRCNGKKIAGFLISEIEDIYIITILCFINTFQPSDFFSAVWVPPEVKDKMLEPLTSIGEESSTSPTEDEIKTTIISCFEHEFSIELKSGSMTREEKFGYEKQRSLVYKGVRSETSEKPSLLKKISLLFSGKNK